MRAFLLFFMCLLCPGLYANAHRQYAKTDDKSHTRDITFYCKKAMHKESIHSISGIDYIYVINQHKDLGKFRMLKKSFKKYEITPYRFDAVDPAKMDYKTLKNIGFNVKENLYQMQGLMLTKCGKNIMLQEYPMLKANSTYFHRQMTLFGIASNLNFLSVIFDAYKSKYDTAWVMEDNAKILVNPNILTGCLIQLDEEYPNWDILYTDKQSRAHRPLEFENIISPIRPDITFESSEFYKARETGDYPFGIVGLRSGAYSFIISKKGMKKVVDYYKQNKFFIPFEIEMQVIPKMNLFYLQDEVVTDNPVN